MRPYLEVQASCKAVVIIWVIAVLLPLLIVLLVIAVAVAEVVAVGVIFAVVEAVAVVAAVVEGHSPSRAWLGFMIFEGVWHIAPAGTDDILYIIASLGSLWRYGLYFIRT